VVSVVQIAGFSAIGAIIIGYVTIPFAKKAIKESREARKQIQQQLADTRADIEKAKIELAERKKMMAEGNQRYVKFKAMTDPCPHCLGTGRLPKEGFSFTEQAMQEFNIDRAMSQVPEPFLKAFEDEEKAEGGDS